MEQEMRAIQLRAGKDSLTFILFDDGHAELEDAVIRSGFVKIPASVCDEEGREYALTALDDGCFQGQQVLKCVVVPEGVREIRSAAFGGCGSLKTHVLPASLESFEYMLYLCPQFAKPGAGHILYCGPQERWNELVQAGRRRMSTDDTDYLDPRTVRTNVQTIPDALPDVEYERYEMSGAPDAQAVLHQYNVGGELEIPETWTDPETGETLPVTLIGWAAFSGNKTLKSVIIPPTVRKISNDAFYGCTALETVIIRPGTEKIIIGRGAFYGCKNLRLVQIGRPEKIGSLAFLETDEKLLKIVRE